jgi:hypothetical protein
MGTPSSHFTPSGSFLIRVCEMWTFFKDLANAYTHKKTLKRVENVME